MSDKRLIAIVLSFDHLIFPTPAPSFLLHSPCPAPISRGPSDKSGEVVARLKTRPVSDVRLFMFTEIHYKLQQISSMAPCPDA